MSETISSVLAAGLELLRSLREDRVPPDVALARVAALRAEHPGRGFELVWEREAMTGRIHYDLLVREGDETIVLGACADGGVPFPMRGVHRFTESFVLRVDGRAVEVQQAITSLDVAWKQLHVGPHLVNLALVELALARGEVAVSDAELEGELDEFRRRRRLFSAEETEAWMEAHGTTQAQLEEHLRIEAARRKLRAEAAGARVDDYFAAHRAELDRVRVIRLEMATQADAEETLRAAREERVSLLELARRRFADGGGAADLFVTLRRRDLGPEEAEALFATAPGAIAPPLPSGDGLVLCEVLSREPARLDTETRKEIATLIFDEWLADRRLKARIEWFWGALEPEITTGRAWLGATRSVS
jgi:putative peptide maturation system protein